LITANVQIKTLIKPLSNQLRAKAVQPGWFRQSCLRYGRFHHNLESRAMLRLAGHKAKSVKPVTDDAAVAIGATVFSELFVFSVAGALLAFEMHKKSRGQFDDQQSMHVVGVVKLICC
jgi:hypothetical protein